jgi:transcriptional regulator with XRE-family HTH domain
VPELGSPLVRRRRLAAELRRLREESSLTGEEVAESLGWSSSKLSRIETARIGIKLGDLSRLLDHYGVSAEYREELLAVGAKTRSRGWWDAYADAWPERFAPYLVLESEAESIWAWSPELVPGLLQTQEYARAAINAHMAATSAISPGEIERRVQTRMRRQQILTGANPTTLTCVLDESVLLRLESDARIMHGQLAHLLAIGDLDNVTLRVLPLAGAHSIGTGAFMLLQFAPIPGIGPASDIVYIEQLSGSALYVDDDAETHQYRLGFGHLVAESLDPAASADLIASVMRAAWN